MKTKKNSRKHGRSRFPARLILILLILIAAAAVILLIQPGFELNLSNPFVKTEKTASSTAILKQVKEISRLDSIEFIYKTVFPYDLIDSSIDLRSIINRYKAGEKMNFNEVEALAVYGISYETDIDLLSDSYNFAVISTRIKAGWEFPDDAGNMISIDEVSNSVKIKMPQAEITEIIIEDADSSIYDYPDIEISPEQWKTLTSIISRKVKAEAEKRGILEAAEERGRELVIRLLKSSGFTQVTFSD